MKIGFFISFSVFLKLFIQLSLLLRVSENAAFSLAINPKTKLVWET